MANLKSTPSSPKPKVQDGWVRKCDLDAWLGRHLPVPTQVISNEEYLPIPQTALQRRLEHQIISDAEQHARRLGMDRRQFLRTSCGIAAAFAAMNTVFGHMFHVHAAELFEAFASENKTHFFIFDVQTHHVATPSEAPHGDPVFREMVVNMRGDARGMDPALKNREPRIEDAYLENYIKEVFLDSETDMVALSAVPAASDETDVLTPEVIHKSQSLINELTRSPRVISHGYFSPDLGQQNLESMDAQMEKLKIDAWKGFTGQARVKGLQGWRLDDQKLTYPALEYSRKKGIKNICLHKGLPFPGVPQWWWDPMDVTRAAKDFPDLNFLVYHSGFKGLADAPKYCFKSADSLPWYCFKSFSSLPWVSDLCDWKKQNPEVKNVYMEIGGTFALTVSTSPMLAAHVLGMIIDAFGPEHVLWGTDSVWWGSPQWQIEAFRRLEMPEPLMKRFGWKPLTAEVKSRIFGLNAAQLYGIDPQAKRNPVPGDYVEKLRRMYQQSGVVIPSNTQYGWVASDSLIAHQ